MSVLGSIVSSIVGHIAHFLHPDKPREFFFTFQLPTDLTREQVMAALDGVAKTNPQFKNWATSIVDLMKLTHPEAPDEAASNTRRTQLAADLGRTDYVGSADDNIWLHAQVIKALQQRGIPLPIAE